MHKITSPFGQRNAVYDSKGKLVAKAGMHNGCDYGTYGVKLPQYALENGVVLSAGKDSSGAIFAWVRYARLGIELLHYHLDSLKVSKGQAVSKDTIIGYTGTTGNSTGIHLHLGFRKVGSTQYYDPESYDYVEYVAPIIEPTPSNEEVYIVVAGDTLSKIVSKYNTTYQKLAEYNGIKNPNLINVGQKIRIPSVSTPEPVKEEPKPVETAPVVDTELKIGDTIEIIGRYASSSMSGNAPWGKAIGCKRQILDIWDIAHGKKENRPYPYQVGNETGTTGFFKAESLKKI